MWSQGWEEWQLLLVWLALFTMGSVVLSQLYFLEGALLNYPKVFWSLKRRTSIFLLCWMFLRKCFLYSDYIVISPTFFQALSISIKSLHQNSTVVADLYFPTEFIITVTPPYCVISFHSGTYCLCFLAGSPASKVNDIIREKIFSFKIWRKRSLASVELPKFYLSTC